MVTYEDIKKSTNMYRIPKSVHCNKNCNFDFRLYNALVCPDEGRDYKYDFDVFLPKYGINLQRDYVWKHPQQNEFILSLLLEKPIDPLVVIEYNDDRERNNTVVYVIDGKQRLITIKKFANNEFPIIVNGNEVYFKDFDDAAKWHFKSCVNSLTANVYYSYDYEGAPMNMYVTDDMKIILFNYYNFSGEPQTEEHKNKLQSLLKLD